MPTTAAILETTEQWLRWLFNCAMLPMATAECRPFWQWIIYAGAALAIAIVAWVIWNQIDYKMKYAAAMRAQAERERIAEPEMMRQHIFKEAAEVAEMDVTDPHLAEKIRTELEKQKLQKTAVSQS